MKIIVSVLSALAWVAIEIMVILNPSGTLPLNERGLWFLVFFISTPLAAFLFPFAAFKVNRKNLFFIIFPGGFIILLLISFYGGYIFHRDFYVYATQIIFLYLIIFLLRLDSLGLVKKKKDVYPALFIGTFVIFVLWTIWLMMMFYTIVLRTEPRWIESTIYNLINGLIDIILLYSAVFLWENAKRRINFRKGNLYLDDRNISKILSPQENHMCCLFLMAPDHVLNCKQLTEHLKKKWPEEENVSTDCDRCIKEKWTVSSCTAYRNLKNRIIATKKYLELLQLGTIVPVSENPQKIKKSGWCLRMFDDVRCTMG
ncbi:MAG: hypothetical protein PF693_13200 [Spirochaetia bacterium]|jgi:hypothetical protein|nr:hypothetical protein [Spirochaetia bacterium]